ncbi:peptidase M61 domain protein [Flammeovirgaceae bacterium 311]|nr:peptidase M61 domain protein [Flammeovirgaceae bacterium 311]
MRSIAIFLSTVLICILNLCAAQAQEIAYRYAVDLTRAKNDQLEITLKAPPVKQRTITFFMPKIIPGTYAVSDYGMFVSALKAFDKKGKQLPVQQTSVNSWQISKADKLVSLTYTVDDITDTGLDNNVFMMAASNIEEGKNFVIQPSAFFGYFEGMKQLPFEVSITKPQSFYGSTGLSPLSTSADKDVYRTKNYDLLIDAPFMYNVPDTTFVKVGNTDVLISVYAPGKKVTSAYLAKQFEKMLQAQKRYLGNTLPVNKYAFILYFADPKQANPRQGALEHNQSSFYYFSEAPQEILAPHLIDIAAHEFFHIITPLTIHSKEIADFNFNEPVLSQHLWLYEGVTEYASDHVQVRSNLNSADEFLAKLAEKIKISQGKYNDTLPFTTLSKESAGKWAAEYQNVYEKGALIAAMLDIRLIELSEGALDLQDLMLTLSNTYGMDRPFEDDQLFTQIEALTYPEIGDFFRKHVAGNQPIPYQEYFDKVGIVLKKEPNRKAATLGNIGLIFNQEKLLLEVNNTDKLNEFGKEMGYRKGDLLVSLQGNQLLPNTLNEQLSEYNKNTKEGSTVAVKVLRKSHSGDYQEVVLTAPALLIDVHGPTSLTINPDATAQQRKYRAVWLEQNPVLISPDDVKSAEAVVKTLYEVISGPAGPRDWDRFNGLFKPDALMAAMVPLQDGKLAFKAFKPNEYKEMNGPYFSNNGFFEEEIGREIKYFGEMAHVWSAYHFKPAPDANPEQRGINSIQLVYDQGRWWISNILWNAERKDNPIPETLISTKKPDTMP